MKHRCVISSYRVKKTTETSSVMNLHNIMWLKVALKDQTEVLGECEHNAEDAGSSDKPWGPRSQVTECSVGETGPVFEACEVTSEGAWKGVSHMGFGDRHMNTRWSALAQCRRAFSFLVCIPRQWEGFLHGETVLVDCGHAHEVPRTVAVTEMGLKGGGMNPSRFG